MYDRRIDTNRPLSLYDILGTMDDATHIDEGFLYSVLFDEKDVEFFLNEDRKIVGMSVEPHDDVKWFMPNTTPTLDYVLKVVGYNPIHPACFIDRSDKTLELYIERDTRGKLYCRSYYIIEDEIEEYV